MKTSEITLIMLLQYMYNSCKQQHQGLQQRVGEYYKPLFEATNFNIRISKAVAEELLKEDCEDIMCKEYGDDEGWAGLTIDDLDPDTQTLDEDYKTFEVWTEDKNRIQYVLDLCEELR